MLMTKKISKPTMIALGLLTMLAFDVPVQAGDYETRVVVTGLTRPTGIVVGGNRTLYITQLPTPGVPGSQGGENTVDLIKLGPGRLFNLTTGEPEPTNLALDKKGHLYWTCKSAGVILERNRRGVVSPFLTGLAHPSGIDVDRWGRVYFTQIPTPGVPGSMGGTNTVNVSNGVETRVLTMGEPEPTDIVVSHHGTAYWTCKSAGVILCRTPDGTVSLLLNQLEQPTGIALDEWRGRLYFTEVPTPGVPGSQGGLNRVSVFNLRTGELDTVDEGDPEPTDIAIAPNGSVFWTCSSAGVIVQARKHRDRCDWNGQD
jgi:sugar lactone lactonase YvrE